MRTRIAVVVLALGLGIACGWLLRGRRVSQAAATTIERERELEKILRDLAVPSVLLYFDSEAGRELADLHQRCFAKHGVKEFLPYQNVLAIIRTGEPGAASYSDGKGAFVPTYPADRDWSHLWSGSYELVMLNRSMQAVGRLTFQLEESGPLAGYLRAHPEAFERKIRPLVAVRLRARHRDTQLRACRLFLAWGDRSEEINAMLKGALQLPKGRSTRDGMTWVEYGMDTIEAARLVKRYALDVGIDVEPILAEAATYRKQHRRPDPSRPRSPASETPAERGR
ncbi:hypothetical protein ACFL09_02465 [Planctomycetota bacterium]